MNTPAPSAPRPFWKSPLFVITAVILGTAGITAAGTAYWLKHNLYASKFSPVTLSGGEKDEFKTKLVAMSVAGGKPAEAPAADAAQATDDPKRTLTLSEREINAFLAEQGLGETVKVELGEGKGTATAIVPIEKDALLFAGKTLRIQCAFKANMTAEKKLALSISDLSVGGISLPNAWIGNLKGMNLFQDTDLSSEPSVKGLVAGVQDFNISGGNIKVKLND